MAIHHIRFPFDSPYGYVEVEHDTATDGALSDAILAEYAQAAVSAEAAMVEAGGGVRSAPGIVRAAIAHGATPLPPYAPGADGVPTMPSPPQPPQPPRPPAPASAQQVPEMCSEDWCRQPGAWRTTKDGDRVLECTNPNHTVEKGGRTYPFTIRWANSRGRR